MKSSRVLNASITKRQKVVQSENADLNYTVNWGAQIDTATISTSTWASEDNITITNQANSTTKASANLKADIGTHRVINKITTTDGQTDERMFILTVTDNDGYERDYE